MSEERWKPVRGYEGLYEVSDWGRVRSLERRMPRRNASGRVTTTYIKPRIMRQFHTARNLILINLSDEHGQSSHYVSRLVAEAWLPTPLPGQLIVHHKDGDSTNNTVTNLKWMTREEHARKMIKEGIFRRPRYKIDDAVIKECRRLHAHTKLSQYDIAERIGVSQSTVSKIVRKVEGYRYGARD